MSKQPLIARSHSGKDWDSTTEIRGDSHSPAASKGMESKQQATNQPMGSLLLSRANSLADRKPSEFGCWD